MVTPPIGPAPSGPPNRCRICSFHFPEDWDNLKTVPPQKLHTFPPNSVVPYRLPALSRAKAPKGPPPSPVFAPFFVPRKVWSTLKFQLPPEGESSNTVPQPLSQSALGLPPSDAAP